MKHAKTVINDDSNLKDRASDAQDELSSGDEKSSEGLKTPDGETHQPLEELPENSIMDSKEESGEPPKPLEPRKPGEPDEEPGGDPAEEPAEESSDDPEEISTVVPVEIPLEIPAEVTLASAVKDTAEDTTTETVEDTTTETVEDTTTETVEDTTTETVKDTTTETVKDTTKETAEDRGADMNFQVDYSTLTREDLLDRLQELLDNKDVRDLRSDVDNIKINYYKKYKLEVEQKRKHFVEKGGDIDDFSAPDDPLEPRIKELLKRYRSLKAESNRTMEQEKIANVEKKYAVIEKIKDLINRKESINKTFQEFRELQKEWRSIGLVPQQNLKDLWETYNHHVETFYDYIKINQELRDLDLKKNLEAKIVLCEKAEQLMLEPSIIEAFKKLQKYHDQWREIGPVPSEMRTEIWERFREATSKINKKHQQHFENLKKEQKNNLEQKRILCEKAEDICNYEFKTIREWEKKSQELIELQKVWRTIGFAPKKDNNKIYKRFRTACDQFFARKREFYTQNKEMYMNNLQLKTDLCIQAESLKDSSEWKKTTEDLIHLQEQWKLIGPVPRKHSDQIWKRFRAACDHFFNRKSEYYSSIDQTFESNLAKKEKLVSEIEKFVLKVDLAENFKHLNEFQRRWAEIGFVPLKDKDAIQERYRLALNNHYDNLKIDDHKRNLLKFRNRISSLIQKPKADLKLRQEREKFVIRMQQLKNDITLWENNIGFFAKSKNAQSMIDEVNNKIISAKEAIKLLEAKIEMIDNLESDKE